MSRKKIGTISYYMTSSKEGNFEYINEFEEEGFFDGMTNKEIKKFKENWIYAMYEVEFELDIYSDGSSKIVKVNGNPVIRKPSQLK